MKSAYLFASILAPMCIFAQALDNHEDQSPKPMRARQILGNRARQTTTNTTDNDWAPLNYTSLNYTFSNTNTTTLPIINQSDTANYTVQTPLPLKEEGNSSGIRIDTYTKAHCKGPNLSNVSLIYDVPIEHQLKSYYLHSDIGPGNVLSTFDAIDTTSDSSKPADPSLENNLNLACAQSDNNAFDVEGTAGCHSLESRVGCIMIGVLDASK